MSKAIDAAHVDGELIALNLAVREIAKQVAALSDGQPFLSEALETTLKVVEGLSQSVRMVDEMPPESVAHIEKMLRTTEKQLGSIFAPASNTMSIPIRH